MARIVHKICNTLQNRVEYSRAYEQRTLWERAFCPLFGGCPYLGGLPLFDYNYHLSMMFNDTRNDINT